MSDSVSAFGLAGNDASFLASRGTCQCCRLIRHVESFLSCPIPFGFPVPGQNSTGINPRSFPQVPQKSQ